MPIHLTVSVQDEFGPALRRLMLKTQSIDGALDEIGGMLETSTQRRFESEETPDGDKWKEHSAATKKQRGEGASILRDEINLYDVTHEVQGDAVAVGTNLIYGRIHQLGGQAGRNHAVTIPARPYLGLSSDDKTEIGAIISDLLQET